MARVLFILVVLIAFSSLNAATRLPYRNYYEILDADPNESPQVLSLKYEKAYAKAETTAERIEITRAYRALSNPRTKARYDKFSGRDIEGNPHFPAWSDPEFIQFIESMERVFKHEIKSDEIPGLWKSFVNGKWQEQKINKVESLQPVLWGWIGNVASVVALSAGAHFFVPAKEQGLFIVGAIVGTVITQAPVMMGNMVLWFSLDRYLRQEYILKRWGEPGMPAGEVRLKRPFLFRLRYLTASAMEKPMVIPMLGAAAGAALACKLLMMKMGQP